jgi:hypothetical protein
MIGTLVQLLIVCIVIGVIWWLVDFVPVPEPLNRLIKVVSIVIGVIVIIYALLGLAGMAPRLA